MISVPGVVVRAQLDRPLSWRGRWQGEDVDVVVLPVVPEPAIRGAALSAMQPLVGRAPGCRAAVLSHDGIALLGTPVAGRPLASLPPLSVGHAVAVGIPVAQALATLHARGLVWGGTYDDVLVDEAGRVGLPLHGLAERRLAGQRRSPREDVHALIAMLRERCPELEVEADDAATLARRLRRAARPRPLVVGAPRLPRPSRQPRSLHLSPHLSPRLVLAGAGVVAVVVVGAVGAAGWESARTSPPRADVRPAAAQAIPTDWSTVVDRLDSTRASALSGAVPLADADAVGSAVLASDTSVAARLHVAAPRTVPPAPVVSHVDVVRADATSAVLRVTDAMPAYAYRDATGRTIATEPARGAHTWTVTLSAAGSGWRFATVT